jgi:hypothetical protein
VKDDFAVAVGLEFDVLFEAFPERPVVVDLAVDSKSERFVVVDDGLSTCVDAHYGETFVAEYGVTADDTS